MPQNARTSANPDDRSVETLDLRGLNCPLPVLKTAKRLARLPAGARLAVLASDPLAGIDIPHHCATSGDRLVASETVKGPDGGRWMRFEIEKG